MSRLLPTAFLWFCLLSPAARGVLVQYTLDPAASQVTVTANFAGLQLEAQTPGSDRAGFIGTFIGDLDNGMVDLQSGYPLSELAAVPQLPGHPGDPHLSSFGFRGQSPTIGQVFVSLGPISFYISSEFSPPLDVRDGTFGPTDFGFFLSDGTYFYSTPTIERGAADLHGRGAPNQATRLGTLTTANGVETLVVPIETSFAITSLSFQDTVLTFSGQFVAHRVVPEPAGGLLLALSSAGLLLVHRRSRSRASGETVR